MVILEIIIDLHVCFNVYSYQNAHLNIYNTSVQNKMYSWSKIVKFF